MQSQRGWLFQKGKRRGKTPSKDRQCERYINDLGIVHLELVGWISKCLKVLSLDFVGWWPRGVSAVELALRIRAELPETEDRVSTIKFLKIERTALESWQK